MNPHTVPAELSGFNGRRVLIVGTGALAVAGLPGLVQQFQALYPDTAIRVAITRQAGQFVTQTAFNLITDRPVFVDTWTDEPYEEAPHVQITRWAEAVVVYPATLHFVSRLANGLADTPLMLALQCTDVPIGLAPSLPPGGFEGHAYRRAAALLKERPNTIVADPVVGRSMTTGELNTGPPAPFSELLSLLHDQLQPRDADGTAPR